MLWISLCSTEGSNFVISCLSTCYSFSQTGTSHKWIAVRVLVCFYGITHQCQITPDDLLLSSGPLQVSEHPVIMSIENHCSVEQQRVMAQHLNHILGEKLLKNTLVGKAPIRLPSPQVSWTLSPLSALLTLWLPRENSSGNKIVWMSIKYSYYWDLFVFHTLFFGTQLIPQILFYFNNSSEMFSSFRTFSLFLATFLKVFFCYF